jgi:hypothetical protein
MTLLCVDASKIRDAVQKQGIDVVPCLFIQYFDGETQLLTDKLIHDWIDEVTDIITPVNNHQAIQPIELKQPPHPQEEAPVNKQVAPTEKKNDVMSMAMSMQKNRETDDSVFNKKKYL